MGPGRCREDSALGTQAISNHRSAPAFSLGARRVHSGGASAGPPPGAYEASMSIGKQVRGPVCPAVPHVVLAVNLGVGWVVCGVWCVGCGLSVGSTVVVAVLVCVHDCVCVLCVRGGGSWVWTSLRKCQASSRVSTAPSFSLSYKHTVKDSTGTPGPKYNLDGGVG